jgi:hypothetical protein
MAMIVLLWIQCSKFTATIHKTSKREDVSFIVVVSDDVA